MKFWVIGFIVKIGILYGKGNKLNNNKLNYQSKFELIKISKDIIFWSLKIWKVQRENLIQATPKMGIITPFSPFLGPLTDHCCLSARIKCFLSSKGGTSLVRQTLVFLTPTFNLHLFLPFAQLLFLFLTFLCSFLSNRSQLASYYHLLRQSLAKC